MLFLQKYAQDEYYLALRAAAEQQLADVRKLIACYDPNKLTQVYHKLHPGKQLFITPLCISNEQYVKEWCETDFEGNPCPFNNTEYYSEKGERLRSKSEMIIADRLYRAGIPYRYEAPLFLPDIGTIYPDFTVLNPRTLKVYYWEHFGMMQDPDYTKNFQLKVETYSSIGIMPGKNLIFTFEYATRPFNIKTVMRNIDEYLT